MDVYTDVPTDHQLDLELNAMAVLWESRKEGQSVRPVNVHLVLPTKLWQRSFEHFAVGAECGRWVFAAW